jgi:hypothetical protein
VQTDSNGNASFNALTLGFPNMLPKCSIDGGAPSKSCIDATTTRLNVNGTDFDFIETSELSPAVVLQ